MRTCRHFPECGGCKFQDIPYKAQLLKKEEYLNQLIKVFQVDSELKPINHYQEWFYRNKMEFTFSEDDKGNLICGLHKKENKREVFDVKECLIFSSYVGLILDKVREFLGKKYSAYNKFTHKGFLRHLIVRETKFTRKVMLGIVTTSKNVLDKEGFLGAVLSLDFNSKIECVYWVVNDNLGDAVTFQKKELVYGQPSITESLYEFNFKIFIDSFFQTNPFAIRDFYKKIEHYANLEGKEKILDLYCGIGSIGIFLARKAKFIWGVEVKKEIVGNAFLNAQINNIENITFISSDVKKFLARSDLPYVDIVVLNPPRCGLSRKVKQQVIKIKPPIIFYSSCNPKTFFPDLKDFSSHYQIEFIEPFDFFPHTPHLEVLAILKKHN